MCFSCVLQLCVGVVCCRSVQPMRAAEACAVNAMGLIPMVITSVGASQWGANHADFTWLDMESICLIKVL